MRSGQLDEALLLLGKASQRAGLQIAGVSDQHRPALEARYGRRTDEVVSGAARREQRLLSAVKLPFARASGHYALLLAGVPEAKVRKDSKEDFELFLDTYAGSANREVRDTYGQKLQTSARARARSQRKRK